MEIAFGVLALPENIKTLIEIGRLILKKIESYRNAPNLLQEWRKYGYELCEGSLRLQLQLAATLLKDNTNQDHCSTVTGHLDDIQNVARHAKLELDRCFSGGNGNLDRMYFAMKGRTRLRDILTRFQSSIFKFTNFLILTSLSKQSNRSTLLPSNRFQMISLGDAEDSTPLDHDSRIRLGSAEYGPPGEDIREICVLVERQDTVKKNESDVEEMVAKLSQLLNVATGPFGGILEYLGYRREPHLELIFQIPEGLTKPTMLQNILELPLCPTQRYQIALNIARGVALVQSAGLVHKSLRPETVLMLEDNQAPLLESRYRLFLTTWTMLRSEGDATARKGSNDWTENIYRHPRRQGLKIERRYTMRHDIYSLGVTLLELGLAQTFVQRPGTIVQPGPCYKAAAMDLSLTSEQLASDSENEALFKPENVRKIMLHLAGKPLEQKMGTRYAEIVRRCLRAVEDIQGVVDRTGDSTSLVDCFSKTVLDPLTDLVGVQAQGEGDDC